MDGITKQAENANLMHVRLSSALQVLMHRQPGLLQTGGQLSPHSAVSSGSAAAAAEAPAAAVLKSGSLSEAAAAGAGAAEQLAAAGADVRASRDVDVGDGRHDC